MAMIESFVRVRLVAFNKNVHLPRVQGPPVTANSMRGGRESRKPSLQKMDFEGKREIVS